MRNDRLARLWLWTMDTAPIWLSVALEPIAARLRCAWHGHTPFIEMDDRTVVCAVCTRLLNERRAA